ncbi:MAG: hypothetical protein AABZ60_23070 [Planctomycetota bacterium]
MKWIILGWLLLFLIACQQTEKKYDPPVSNQGDKVRIQLISDQVANGPHYPLKKPITMEVQDQEEFSVLTVKNKTDFPLEVFLEGPTYRCVKLRAEQSQDISLDPGTYYIVVVFESNNKAPGFVEGNFQGGGQYLLHIHYPAFFD